MAKQSIGEFLATLRKANGYTQQEVADRLGISNRTLSGWECNNVLPDILLLPALSELYGVTVDEILAGERKEKAEVELTNKSEKRILKSKIARFSTQCYLLLGLIIIGMFFVGACLVLNVGAVATGEVLWWVVLLLGSILSTICLALLFAFWKGAESFGEDMSDEYAPYCLILRKKMANSLYIVAAVGIVGAIAIVVALLIELFYGDNGIKYFDYLASRGYLSRALFPCIMFALFGVALFVTGWLLYKNALTKFGGETARQSIKRDRNRFWAVGFWGLFPLVLSIVLLIVTGVGTLSIDNKTTMYENANPDEFVEYMETLEALGKEYHFPLSKLARTAKNDEEYDLGDGFVAVFHRFSFTIYNEQIMLLNLNGEKLDMAPFTIEVPRVFINGAYSFYNVRYYYHYTGESAGSIRSWFVDSDSEVEIISCGGEYSDKFVRDEYYTLEKVGDGFAYVYKITRDYSLIGYTVGAAVIVADVIVCAMVCVARRNKFNVKL